MQLEGATSLEKRCHEGVRKITVGAAIRRLMEQHAEAKRILEDLPVARCGQYDRSHVAIQHAVVMLKSAVEHVRDKQRG